MSEAVSDWVSVTNDVHQGSVLRPRSFAIFINDIPYCIKSTCMMFADDTKIIYTIHPTQVVIDTSAIQADIDRVIS